MDGRLATGYAGTGKARETSGSGGLDNRVGPHAHTKPYPDANMRGAR
jgi:hypothetical protein